MFLFTNGLMTSGVTLIMGRPDGEQLKALKDSQGNFGLNITTHWQTGLQLLSCHHQNEDCPKSQRTHLPGSQQMRGQLLEPAGHL